MKTAFTAISVMCAIVIAATFQSPSGNIVESVTLVVIQFVSLWILLCFYFLGFLVAIKRDHKDCTAIFALNLLTGWTFIGWVISLVWALKTNKDVA